MAAKANEEMFHVKHRIRYTFSTKIISIFQKLKEINHAEFRSVKVKLGKLNQNRHPWKFSPQKKIIQNRTAHNSDKSRI
jgi:hypothetical protein